MAGEVAGVLNRGGAMASSSELAARVLGTTFSHGRKLERERGGKEARSALRKSEADAARFGRTTGGGSRRTPVAILCALSERKGMERAKIGWGRRLGLERAQKGKPRGRKWGSGERGAPSASGFGCRGREGRRRLREEMGEADSRALRVRERREEMRGGCRLGLGPRKERRGRRGPRGGQAEMGERGRENRFFLLIFQQIFKVQFSNGI